MSMRAFCPARDFAHNKNINARQVYEELKSYLAENKKLRRIVCCYSEGSRERVFSLMSEYGLEDLVLPTVGKRLLKKPKAMWF